jgi:putative restriction endonuclease
VRDIELDRRIRLTAFEWLAEQTKVRGDVLPRTLLAEGFPFDRERIPLVSPQGIFTPRGMAYPLSIATTTTGPYDDAFATNEMLQYRYRGSDPEHRDNVGLREAMRADIPLVYLHSLVPGKYLAIWPVFVVGDSRETLTFTVQADDVIYVGRAASTEGYTVASNLGGEEARRGYITTLVRQRLHQRSFRERVLLAYQSQCTCCRLRHVELLDAAHIIPDTDPLGEPRVTNGLSLCKLHHAAFDGGFLGIRPDYSIEIRRDILEEEDGPILAHGLQGLHNKQIVLPHRKEDLPDRGFLLKRYEGFRTSSTQRLLS